MKKIFSWILVFLIIASIAYAGQTIFETERTDPWTDARTSLWTTERSEEI